MQLIKTKTYLFDVSFEGSCLGLVAVNIVIVLIFPYVPYMFQQLHQKWIQQLVQPICLIANFTDILDCFLNDFFYHGLNYPYKSTLIRNSSRGSFQQVLDIALLISGSSFTIGKVDYETPKHQFPDWPEPPPEFPE